MSFVGGIHMSTIYPIEPRTQAEAQETLAAHLLFTLLRTKPQSVHIKVLKLRYENWTYVDILMELQKYA